MRTTHLSTSALWRGVWETLSRYGRQGVMYGCTSNAYTVDRVCGWTQSENVDMQKRWLRSTRAARHVCTLACDDMIEAHIHKRER